MSSTHYLLLTAPHRPHLKKMHQTLFQTVIIALISALLFLSPPSTCQRGCNNPTAQQVRAGFWFPTSNRYYPLSQINCSLYTHLYYSPLPLDSSGPLVRAPTSPDELSLFASFSSTLKSRVPSLKTLVSISSIDLYSNENSSSAFSSMAGHVDNRATFINSAMELARTYGFDGLDLSWQFPSSSSDMANFGLLLEEWRTRIEEEARKRSPPLLLTASVYFSGHLFDAPSEDLNYPINAMSGNLDWANALSFAYHSDTDVTVANAALYDVTSHFSTSYGITSWLDAGLPPCKLVMGIPLYGRSWFLKNKKKYGVGAEVVADGPKKQLSNHTGIMAYFEIKELLKDPDAEFMYDNRTVSTYLHVRSTWVSFDSPGVVESKIVYARKKELLGYFLWPISFDSPNNTISKLASDVWTGNLASEDKDDFSPQGPAKSLSISGSRRKDTSVHNFLLLSHYLLLFLAFFFNRVDLLFKK